MARRETRTPELPKATRELELPDPDAVFALWLGERLRRLALGLTIVLVTIRAYWPSEADLKVEGGHGLVWVAGLLVAAGLALASALVGGRLQVRWSWADAAAVALFALIGVSATTAADHRTAVNLAWEWGAVGTAYVLLRTLPKTRPESAALTAALVAAAVAVALYGIFQVGVELEEVRQLYLKHPRRALALLGIAPGSPAQLTLENRLLRSNEPWSTFALTNSLAGFIVGPLVLLLAVAWETLIHRDEPGKDTGWRSKRAALACAAVPGLVLLVCLLLTKSRSAYAGLAVGVAAVLSRSWRRVHARTLALAAGAGVATIGVLVAVGLATGRLDQWVLTESFKSLRYRWEYWVGTWHLITERPGAFWSGVGPGNFGWAYVRYKLPQASEEIQDPHNLVLEAWSTAGVGAALALVAALGLALWNLLAPEFQGEAIPHGGKPGHSMRPDAPPRRPGWLMIGAGLGLLWMAFWSLVILFDLELIMRWFVLGLGWLVAVGGRWQLWHRRAIPAAALGAGALAIVVNLLAAGGIGIPAVSVLLWALIALGLNLRDDRPCSRLREAGGRLPAFFLAIAWAALAGLFAGAALTYTRTERALAEAEIALRSDPPRYDQAQAAYQRAIRADRFSARPFLGEALTDFQAWRDRKALIQDRRWQQIPISLYKAVEPPRNPNAWTLHRQRAIISRQLLDQLGPSVRPHDALRLKGNIIESSRKAALLYPTNATLRAALAEASADIGMMTDAAHEAEEALRLDELTPHRDKKLPESVRARLQANLPEWRKAAGAMKIGGPGP